MRGGRGGGEDDLFSLASSANFRVVHHSKNAVKRIDTHEGCGAGSAKRAGLRAHNLADGERSRKLAPAPQALKRWRAADSEHCVTPTSGTRWTPQQWHPLYKKSPLPFSPVPEKLTVQRSTGRAGGVRDAAVHVRTADQPGDSTRPGACAGQGSGQAPRAQGRGAAEGAGEAGARGPGFRRAPRGGKEDHGEENNTNAVGTSVAHV